MPTMTQQEATTKYPLPFYGPHACEVCWRMIVRYSFEGGGQKFAANYESALNPGQVYPNTNPELEWHEHVCGTPNSLNEPKSETGGASTPSQTSPAPSTK